MHPQIQELIYTALKTLTILAVFIVGLRAIGKRHLGQMNIYDIALVLLLSNAVQNAMTQGSGHLGVGIISALTLILAGRALSEVAYRMPRVGQSLLGSATVIIQNGKLVQRNIQRQGISMDQIEEALREHGCTEVSDVRLGVLEVDGSLSIVQN